MHYINSSIFGICLPHGVLNRNSRKEQFHFTGKYQLIREMIRRTAHTFRLVSCNNVFVSKANRDN